MAKKSEPTFYSVKQPKTEVESFRIIKWEGTDFDEPAGEYTIERFSDEMVCNCPAAIHRRQNCKHHGLLRLFKQNKAINQPVFYNPDTKKWHQPFLEPDE